MKNTRIKCISKDIEGSNYLEYGDIRTIVITPSITKLYELCIL